MMESVMNKNAFGSFRKEWNVNQKRLRGLLSEGSDLQDSKFLFFKQHQPLHRSAATGSDTWSYAEEIFSDLSEEEFRELPQGEDHTLVWILWHISRIEDITMRVLIADTEQEYLHGGWVDELASPIHHTGNNAPSADMHSLTKEIAPALLLSYRDAVGRNTRELVKTLEWDHLRMKVEPNRLERLVKESAVLPEAEDLLAYWGKRKIYELLLMPPTRHLMVHLNEAWTIKKKLQVKN